jgi:hypothetical protein
MAAAGRALQLHPDLTGLARSGSCRLEMVNRDGRPVWQGTLVPPEETVLAPRQRAGAYFFRVYTSTGELLREYALQSNS